jgi:hypothetical protein
MFSGLKRMVSGYVLINTAKGMALKAAEEVVKVNGVNSACAVTGAFDVIATFEVEKIEDIGELVVRGIQTCIEEVCCTQTAICVKCCCQSK